MTNKDLVRYASSSLMKSKSPSGTAGKALVIGGGAAIVSAALLPFITLWMTLAVVMGIGFLLWE